MKCGEGRSTCPDWERLGWLYTVPLRGHSLPCLRRSRRTVTACVIDQVPLGHLLPDSGAWCVGAQAAESSPESESMGYPGGRDVLAPSVGEHSRVDNRLPKRRRYHGGCCSDRRCRIARWHMCDAGGWSTRRELPAQTTFSQSARPLIARRRRSVWLHRLGDGTGGTRIEDQVDRLRSAALVCRSTKASSCCVGRRTLRPMWMGESSPRQISS